MELCLGMADKPAESLWVRIRGQTNVGNIAVGVCYRLPDQGDKAFFRQLKEASDLKTQLLMRDFNHPDIC